jgi:hypothetical protein
MKKTLTLWMAMLITCMAFAQVSTWDGTWEPWTHGTGTEADPFLIENAQQLAYLAYRVNNGLDAGGGHISNHDYHYKLLVDVNLNGSNSFQWIPIGYWDSSTDHQQFGGYFDGNNHTVSGIYINSTAERVGFFAFTGEATIMNLSVCGTRISTSGTHAGGIVGVANSTRIINCSTVFSNCVSGSMHSGGIVGFSGGMATITNCNNTGSVSAPNTASTSSAGGIIGYANESVTITDCHFIGNVSAISGSSAYSGGIVGYVSNESFIANCHSEEGNVSATTSTNEGYIYSYSGGIAGFVENATISNCYNKENISASTTSNSHQYDLFSNSGGIIGKTNTAIITNCYNVGNVLTTGSNGWYRISNAGGIVGVANITEIFNCYNIGNVMARYDYINSGGIVGKKTDGTVENSFYINACGGVNTYGGIPMSSEAMQTEEFVTIINAGSLSYIRDIQPYVNQGYPIFSGFNTETLPATSVAYTSATLHGEYTTGVFNITSRGFEYKKTTDQNYTTISCTGNQTPYSYNLNELLHSTTYHYRSFATAAEGTAYGELVEFTTLTPPTHTITATASNGGTINPSGTIMVYEGDSLTFTITPNTNYAIQSVLVDGVSVGVVSSYTFQNVTSNHTIEATFRSLIYHITASASSGGTINPNGNITVIEGENKTFIITPNTNYTIQSVLVDGVSVGAVSTYTFQNVSSDHTIEVTFRSLIHHITATVTGTSGTISPNGYVEVMEGENKTFIITPIGESAIQSVLVDGNEVGPVSSYTFYNVAADHIIEAVFYMPGRHQILACVEISKGPGTITPNDYVSVIDGEDQTFEIAPIEQSVLDSVIVDGVNIGAVNSYTFHNVTSDHYIIAHFTLLSTPDFEPWDGMTTIEPFCYNTSYYICSPTELAWIAQQTNIGNEFDGKTFFLLNDIDLGGAQAISATWIPIGTSSHPFCGRFWGNNYSIKNLYCNSSGNDNVGLFGFAINACFAGVYLCDVNIIGKNNVGGVVGNQSNTDVRFSCVTGHISGNNNVGGISGFVNNLIASNYDSYYHQCYSFAEIEANDNAGGIIGYLKHIGNPARIRNCYSAGRINSLIVSGGVIGCIDLWDYPSAGALDIAMCYSNATVLGTKSGGLIGSRLFSASNNYYAYHGTLNVSESYVSGSVKNGFGFIAKDNNVSIYEGTLVTCSSCYFDTQSTGCGDNGITGVSPKLTNEMTTNVGFGMTNQHWIYTNGQYPQISWFANNDNDEIAKASRLSVAPVFLQYNENSSEVHTNFQVSTANGVTWSSSDPDVIGINGSNANVNPMIISKTVTLTASLNGISKQINVTVAGSDTIFVYQPNELRLVAEQCNAGVTYEGKYVKLMNDIEFEFGVPNNMTQIGSYPDHPFMGTLDGNGKVIRNVYIDHPNNEYQGFFGYTKDANLYEVGLENLTISGRNYTGGLVSYAENSYIRDSYVNGGTLFALSYVGGLVGYQSPGTNSVICGCYNTCEVTGNNYLGGMVGFTEQATVRNSYVIAPVRGNGNAVGAIIGRADQVLMYNCYFSIEETGQTQAIGENNWKDGDEGMHSAEMKTADFVNKLNRNLVVEVWRSDYTNNINNGFPIIKWQPDYNNPCQPPVNLMVNEVGGLYARLSWQGAADSYLVAYGKDGIYNQTITTTENDIRLEGLQLNSDYVWKIKAICGEHETDYVIGQPFRTHETGVDENDVVSFTISPNPAKENVLVLGENIRVVEIYNTIGQMVLSQKVYDDQIIIHTTKMNGGIYLVKIADSTGRSSVQKLIITK